MELCRELFGWAKEDSQFILDKINEWDINTDDLYNELAVIGTDFRDINTIKTVLFSVQTEQVKSHIIAMLGGSGVSINKVSLGNYEPVIDTSGLYGSMMTSIHSGQSQQRI